MKKFLIMVSIFGLAACGESEFHKVCEKKYRIRPENASEAQICKCIGTKLSKEQKIEFLNSENKSTKDFLDANFACAHEIVAAELASE